MVLADVHRVDADDVGIVADRVVHPVHVVAEPGTPRVMVNPDQVDRLVDLPGAALAVLVVAGLDEMGAQAQGLEGGRDIRESLDVDLAANAVQAGNGLLDLVVGQDHGQPTSLSWTRRHFGHILGISIFSIGIQLVTNWLLPT